MLWLCFGSDRLPRWFLAPQVRLKKTRQERILTISWKVKCIKTSCALRSCNTARSEKQIYLSFVDASITHEEGKLIWLIKRGPATTRHIFSKLHTVDQVDAPKVAREGETNNGCILRVVWPNSDEISCYPYPYSNGPIATLFCSCAVSHDENLFTYIGRGVIKKI